MIKLTKVIVQGDRFTFDDLFVNPDDVSVLEENHSTKTVLREQSNRFPDDLSQQTRFSSIQTSKGTYTVVGEPSAINERLNSNRRLLRG